MTPAKEKYLSFQLGSEELIWAMTDGGAFSNSYHLIALREERCDGYKTRPVPNPTGQKRGARLIVRSTTVSGTLLLATEFCDFLCACYNVTPLNLKSHCNGYGTAFKVRHTLSLSKRGMVIACHNKVHDELLYLS